jgi:hypothetical protein
MIQMAVESSTLVALIFSEIALKETDVSFYQQRILSHSRTVNPFKLSLVVINNITILGNIANTYLKRCRMLPLLSYHIQEDVQHVSLYHALLVGCKILI